MSRRKTLEGEVRAMARGGDAIVATPEGDVYAALAVVGDHVRLGRLEGRGSSRRGTVVEVLRPGSARRESPCAHATRCGGCPWIVMEEEAAAKQKVLRLARVIERLGEPVEVRCERGASLAYRRRARVAWKSGRIGFRARRSRAVVSVDRCVVLAPVLEQALHQLPSLKGEGEASLALRDEVPVAVLRTSAVQPQEVYDACQRLVADSTFAGIVLSVDGAHAQWGDAAPRFLAIDGLPLEGSVGGFAQAHEEVNAALVRYVAEMAEGAHCLELFAGHGNLTVALAQDRKVVAVEQNAAAAEACRASLAARNLAGTVHAADATEFPRRNYDVVVLDPPRVGARDVATLLAEAPPKRVVYVSCNVGTLGRDLAILTAAGMRIVAARAFDMFPQTPHLESVVTLQR
ncbi:MAG: RsmD family RNA methyltransferase [Myxococcota bacterium]